MLDSSRFDLPAFSAALARFVAEAAPGVVSVNSHRSTSSGFAWSDELAVTADEALAEEGRIGVVLAGGERRGATIVGRDHATDVALLKVEGGGLRPLALRGAVPAPGALACVVGAHEGAPLVGFGAVALAGPAWESMRGGRIDARVELDLRLRHQAEGGVALDMEGLAIGMAVFGPRRRALVIPAATIERVAAALARHGRVPRGYLGLGLQPVRVDASTAHGRGVMVMSVDPQGPGAAAGLRQGDVIVALDGKPLSGVNALLLSLGPDSVGRAVRLSVRRSGAPLELALTIGERPGG